MNEKSSHHLVNKSLSKTKIPYIIGIGASAGGLEALEVFFSAVPDQSGLAFVVILHLSPEYKSLMPQLLAKHTKMQVHTIESSMEVLPNNVYVIPPRKTLTLHKGSLYLHDKIKNKIPTFPIDIFFRSMATEQGERAIGVILSGTGSDGTRGLRTIKEANGIVMIQQPESAKFDGMPRAAISTGLVDYVLPPERMPLELINYVAHPHTVLDKVDKIDPNDDSLAKILRIIKRSTGIDFSLYKQETILRRINRKMYITKINDLDAYVDYLENHPGEIKPLQKDLLIGVTKFFRDVKAFEYLETKIIPDIVEKATKTGVKVWVAGCSTGEEAYSIAILIYDYVSRQNLNIPVKIFATDIDKEAVTKASVGVYSASIAADVHKEYLSKYFIRQGENYQISRNIRETIIFTTHDITRDPPFHKLDLVVCRNMLIYFQTTLQKRIFKLFSFALKQNNYLFLGGSESADDMKNLFVAVHSKWKFYRSIFQTNLVNIQEYDRPNIVTPLRSHSNPTLESSVRTADVQQVNIVNDMLTEEYATGCILITEGMEFVRYFGQAHKYISVPKKLTSWSILNMVNDKLSIAISTAVRKALQEKKPIRYSDVMITTPNGTTEILSLIIKPYQVPNTSQKLILIILDKKENQEHIVDEQMALGSNTAQRIQDLEQELKITRESLQATIEELQTSNEELIASNEELQSTNEELQSVNEELHTINSEHQASIMELTELNDDINNLLQSTEIGTLFLDNDLNIRKFNNSIAENISITESDLGRPIEHFANNLDYPDFIENIQNVIKTLGVVEREIPSKDKKWYLIRILPYRTYEDQIRGVVITMVDISNLREAKELKRLTKKLKIEIQERQKTSFEKEELNNFLTQIYRVIPSSIYIYDLVEKKNIFVSQTVESMAGYSPEDIKEMGKKLLQTIISNNDLEKIQKHHKDLELLEREETKTIEYQFKSKNDKTLWMRSIDKAYERNAEGIVTKIIGVAFDVTAEKDSNLNLEKANIKLQKEVRKSNKAKDDLDKKNIQLETINAALESFAYSTSHDLKEPIRSIGSFAQLIQKKYSEALDENGNKYLNIILDKSARLYNTIDSILAYSKLGNEGINLEMIETKNIVDSVISDLNSSIKEANAKIIIGEMPTVKTDGLLFYKILQNLISNSLKFRKQSVPLKVEINHSENKVSHIFSVKDNGMGFDPKYSDMVFEMLKQLKTTEKTGGSGIGLALCKRLIENLDGKIWAESKEDQGSTFSFSLQKDKEI